MSIENNCEFNIEEFNQRVSSAHFAHIIDGKNELIDTSEKASPNENRIYHLYSNGEITNQKGAWAYLQRSEFNDEYEIHGCSKLPFKFINEAADKTTYAILTFEECIRFRNEMKNYILSLKNK